MDQKSKVKKFLSLLKSAQNSAFVGLVCDNLRVELQEKPWKVIKIMDYLIKETSRANSDFTRLKVAEGLVPLLGQFNASIMLPGLLQYAHSEKGQHKLFESMLSLDLSSNESDRAFFGVSEMFQSRKNFFGELLENYQPLLAESSSLSESSQQEKGAISKEGMKQMFLDATLGGKMKTDKLKLSDFIDESFFDDLEEADTKVLSQPKQATQAQQSLKELIQEMKNKTDNHQTFISEGRSHSTKRQKTQMHQNHSIPSQYVLMSPLLAIVIHIIIKDSFVESDWKTRQASINIIKLILKEIVASKGKGLQYWLIGQKDEHFQVNSSSSVSIEDLSKAFIPQLLIVLMKDQFNDFEELKVITPVREEAMACLINIMDNQLSADDVSVLLQNLPGLLKSIDLYASNSWITKYNFFLILKALFSTTAKELKHQAYQMFNRVLIETLNHLEDEVRIIVTDILNLILPLQLEQPDHEKGLSRLLKNLLKNIQQSDEVESSAISVFALINKIIDQAPQLEKLKFHFDVQTICPFNFHRIANVRYSYLQILNKCLNSTIAFTTDDLSILLKITLQSLAMERTKIIVKLNIANLKLIVHCFITKYPQEFNNYLHFLFTSDNGFLSSIIFDYNLTSFDNFLILESKNFETINRDYYKIVYRPVSQDEIQQFYFGKMKNMTKALAIMMEASQEVCALINQQLEVNMMPPQTLAPGLLAPIHDAHLIQLLAVQPLLENDKYQVLDLNYMNQIIQYFLSQFSEDSISFLHFKELQRLQTLQTYLHDALAKQPSIGSPILQSLQPFYQMIDVCYYQQKLINIAGIVHYLDSTLQPMIDGIVDTFPDIYDCFTELKQVFQRMLDYANVTCTRIKQISAQIHLKMLKCQPEYQLTNQLNNLIKPILNQIKKENVEFIQKLASKASVNLVEVLFSSGKVKPAQQVLQLLTKDIEVIKHPEGSGNAVQDRGIKLFLQYSLKQYGNLFEAYNMHFQCFISKPLSVENQQSVSRVLLACLQTIKTKQRSQAEDLYSKEANSLSHIAQSLLQLNLLSHPEVPAIYCQLFELFKSQQTALISTIVASMIARQRLGFETLIALLDEVQRDQTLMESFLPFISVFIIPVIQSIQYSRVIFTGDDKQITLILAQLLSLLPLNLASMMKQHQQQIQQQEESKTSEDTPMAFSDQTESGLKKQAQEGFNFLQVFVNNQIGSEDYKIEIPMKAHLRDYQRQGITWLAQLGKYNLNCALCDDMGLGKTLQSLIVVLNETYIRQKLQASKQGGKKLQMLPAKASPGAQVLSGQSTTSLIVCPTSITYNWRNEIKKYFGEGIQVGVYEADKGSEILRKWKEFDVIIISYEKLRGEIKSFQSLSFYYVILDEAHIIKNSKAKITQACKALQCEKKIVLTGTPLQNKVSELWSIFDFLMPGFLEEENVFNKKYNQYLTSNIKKLSEKLEETQTFINALKSLKKRISPFILRRTKDQVLKELPPKIIQDVACKMTKFQTYVHTLIEKTHPITQSITSGTPQPTTQGGAQKPQQGKQFLQNLILHRKVCNHPMLVAREYEGKDKTISAHLGKKSEDELHAYDQSGKLLGLYDKLVECEIIHDGASGTKEETKRGEDMEAGSLIVDMAATSLSVQEGQASKKHRALIFCQMGSFLRMIVEQILQKFHVPYLELLSSHSPRDRIDIVEHFNTDESIRVLILTTAVGGLGLTLTGADTVIFAEHDWNPMRDLQAIDRAHRIGQTRQVCVYRLIVEDTIEEKIMNLQRFKENLARSLVQARDTSAENGANMELTDLLKSFQEHSAFEEKDDQTQHGKKTGKQATQQQPPFEDKIIKNIEEIWQGGAFKVEDL